MVKVITWCVFLLASLSIFARDFLDKKKLPDWSVLDSFQGEISRNNFNYLLKNVYCPRSSWWKDWIVIQESEVLIRTENGKDNWYRISFKEGNETFDFSNSVSIYPISPSIKGLKIALDPGHIGGEFSEMEGRHFSINGQKPVKEGELSLEVAKILEKKLQGVGVDVILLRNENKPVSNYRPSDFIADAEKWVFEKEKVLKNSYPALDRAEMIKKRSEVLFYRVSEIYARAEILNHKIKPDLTICIHLNAAPWKDQDNHLLVERNDYHVLVNGCYMGGELADPFQRYEMVFRLLQGWHATELKVADNVSRSFGSATNMPAFSYKGPNALKVGDVDGVWARNLLANRIYQCPVVFLEPYVANSKETYERIQLGNYDGEKNIGGEMKHSLVEEYAESVFQGLLSSFAAQKM